MSDDRQFPKGTRVNGLDLSGVHLHGASLEGARLTDAYLLGADISGDIEGLRINGVEVEPLVQAELDRRFPEQVKLRATDLGSLLEGWSMLEGRWADATARAARLPEELQRRRVDDEWSFVETLRHLVFATECWLFRAVQRRSRPYHPWGLGWGGVGPLFAQQMGLDITAAPSLEEILPVRRDHQRAVRTELETLTEDELAEVRVPPDEPGWPIDEHSVLQCIHVILNEEWHHLRYATRDLDVLDPPGRADGQG